MQTPQSDAYPQWENEGGELVLRLWQADQYPQIALLKVSNASFLKFFQDPNGFMDFVNQYQVFSKAVIVAGPWVSLSSVDPKDQQPDWVLTLIHGKMSTMIVSALPQLKLEDDSSNTK
jgi:hypothetical protein